MPTQTVARLAFNRGQVSPLALARVDIDRIELSAEVQTNFMPRVLGSMMLRPGLRYVDTTLSNNYAQHIPFVFSLEDKALIEFTNNSMRVRVDDEIITRPSVSTTVRGGDFSADITNFLKVNDPATTPGGDSNGIAFSPDGQLCAVAHDAANSRTLTVYSVSNTTLTVLGTQPTGQDTAGIGQSVCFSPDGQFLAVTDQTTKGYRVWAITGTGASATFSAVTTSDLSLGVAFGSTFSPDSSLFVVAHADSPYFTMYEISGTGVSATFTALSAPSDLPTGIGDDAAFSPDGRLLAIAHVTSPYTTVYSVNGTTLDKLDGVSSQFAATLPTGNGLSVDFSRDGFWMAVAHSTTPFVSIYAVSGTTFTKASNPGTLPDGNARGVAFSSDSQFLAVAHSTSVYLSHYRNIAGVWTKQSDPATAPDGTGNAVAFSPNNQLMVVAHDSSAYLTAYQGYQWLDLDETGAASTYSTSTTWTTVLSRTLNTTLGAGFTNATVRQILEATIFNQVGTKVRLTFQAAAAGTFSIDKCYIGNQAASGDDYDFASTPTEVTFNDGNPGFSISTGATIVSDEITFTSTESTNYVISFHISGTDYNAASVASSNSKQTIYYKLSTNQAASVNVSGYTDFTTRDLFGITALEVAQPIGNSFPGLSFIGTLYNEAKRAQAVSLTNTDKNIEHALNIVISQGVFNFRVGTEYGEEDLIRETTLTTGYHSLAFTPTTNLFFVQFSSNTQYSSVLTSCQLANSGDMAINTEYTDAIIGNISYTQSADIIYLAAEGVHPYKIERRAAHSWSVVKYLPSDGPFRTLNASNTTIAASALSGDITLTASRDVFRETHEGALFKITSAGQNTSDSFTGANQFSASNIRVTGVGTARSITIVRSGTWSATITLQRSVAEPGSWADVATFTNNGSSVYTDDFDNQIYYYRIGIKTGNYTSGTAVVQLQYASGGIDGVVRINGYTDRKNVSGIVLQPLGSTSSSENWKEGLWSDYRGYPSAVTLYEGRLTWAGKDRIVLSVSDEYESFDEEIEGDSGPINRTIGLGPVEHINWAAYSKTLVLGGQESEFSIGTTSFDEVLTPDNFHIDPVTNVGSSNVRAVKLDKAVIFVSRTGTKLYQLSYLPDSFTYQVQDLSRLVPELMHAKVVKMAYQRYPDTRLHCVLEDGTVAVMVYEQEEQVNCWLKIETDGTVEDCVVLPGDPGIEEDSVYYVVNRTVNGETVRYLEQWALESECEGGTLNKQADAFIIYDGTPTATITGLNHLEGETVVVWGDGIYQGTATVSSGSITISNAVSDAVIGLGYTGQYKSTKLAYAAGNGTALTQRKQVHSVGIIAQNLHRYGIKYGDSFSRLNSLPSEHLGQLLSDDVVHAQADMFQIPISGDWTTDSRVCLEAYAPKPATLLALTFVIETNG